jgi:hypothetical protein
MVALLERREASSCWVSVLVKHSARLLLISETGTVAPFTKGNTRARPHKAIEDGSGIVNTTEMSWVVLRLITYPREKRGEDGTMHI